METAILLPLLLLLAIGAAEVGFAMISQLTGSNAVREGARVGAAGRTNPSAEPAILRSVEQAMCSLDRGDLVSVEIYKADATGQPVNAATLLNSYAPSGPLVCGGAASTSLVCTNGCPWPPSARNDSLVAPDDIGVRITYTHEWVTSFVFGSDATWTEFAVMRLQPDTGGS